MQFGQMEVKTVIHHLVTRYELGVPPGYRVPWDYTALPMPSDRLPLRLRARRHAAQPVGS
jgi:cytochrome P450